MKPEYDDGQILFEGKVWYWLNLNRFEDVVRIAYSKIFADRYDKPYRLEFRDGRLWSFEYFHTIRQAKQFAQRIRNTEEKYVWRKPIK